MNRKMKATAKICLFGWIVLCGAFLAGSLSFAQETSLRPQPPAGLQRGVNFGNMLEAPFEGAWGLTMRAEFFDKAVEGGFDHIRLPVSWTHHASQTAPYTINPTFFQRVDWALDQAEQRGLKVILNMHHYEELNSNPVAEFPRALLIWRQISQRYRNRNEFLVFEILNEPHGQFNSQPQLWNQFMNDVLNVIRKFHPIRPVLVGPVQWNSINALTSTNFKPPKDDNVIITVHHYEPFAFTHQGASWVNPIPPVGTTWNGVRTKISPPWQNWSWGTTVNPALGGIEVTYNQGWAGLYVHSNQGVNACTKLHLSLNQARNLRIVTRNAQQERAYFLNTQPGGGDYTIDLDPTIGPVTDVFIQNNTPNAVEPFLVSRFVIEGEVTESVIRSEFEEVSDALTVAANWAASRGFPLYLGEFGAYEPADMASRVAWTTAVRSEAERLGIGWAYWELAAGFGVFDPVSSTWRVPLLDSLIPPQ